MRPLMSIAPIYARPAATSLSATQWAPPVPSGATSRALTRPPTAVTATAEVEAGVAARPRLPPATSTSPLRIRRPGAASIPTRPFHKPLAPRIWPLQLLAKTGMSVPFKVLLLPQAEKVRHRCPCYILDCVPYISILYRVYVRMIDFFFFLVSADHVTTNPYGQSMASPATSNNSGDGGPVLAMDQMPPGYLDLPDMDRNKPGSLPDLTNFHVNPALAGQANNVGNAFPNHQYDMENQGSPYSSVS